MITFISTLEMLSSAMKRLLSNLFRKSPFSSAWLGAPKGAVFAKAWAENHLARYQLLYPAQRLIPSLPKTISTHIHPFFRTAHQGAALPEIFVLTIPHGRVYSQDGLVITSDDYLLSESASQFGKNIEEHPIFKRFKLPTVTDIDNSVAVLAALGGNNYYHWMFEVLPRLALIEKADLQPDFYYVCQDSPVQKDTLAMAGIPKDKIWPAHRKLHLQARELMVTAFPGASGNMPEWACSFLRERLLPHRASKSFPLKLYISRAKAKLRRVQNEDEIWPILAAQGFQKIFMEDYPVAEQIGMFASATHIVAPHGAALTNLVFSPPGTRVIELFPPDVVQGCYWTLASQVKLDYTYILGDENAHLPHEDMQISPEALANLSKSS
jgi:Glycosyltransferase 61